jgi:hypothetical protein
MNRRSLLQLMLSVPAAPYFRGEPSSTKWGFCGICGSPDVFFDRTLDINVCRNCGAHETTNGWQKR